MKFCTVINCMDGRVQLPVIEYLQDRFNAEYVDCITEAGPILLLACHSNSTIAESILARIHVSVSKHHSGGIAVVGHHDCVGNPVSKEEQLAQIQKSVDLIRQYYKDVHIIGLWVDEDCRVIEV